MHVLIVKGLEYILKSESESGGHCYTYLGIRSPMRGAYIN